MRIAVIYTGFTSYMADCWRTLVERQVELKVWIEDSQEGIVDFNPDKIMYGIDYWWATSEKIRKGKKKIKEAIVGEVVSWGPDIIFICGWSKELPPYIAKSPALKKIPMVLEMDMPWEWRFRKFAARFLLWKHLRRFSAVFVPGQSGAFYARWLGFKPSQIFQGKFGVAVEKFTSPDMVSDARQGGKGFLFVGRLSPEKGIRELASAYKKFREWQIKKTVMHDEIWTLDVYGMGAESRWLENIEGVVMHGFAQPDEIRAAYATAGAFVIASRWDPWPLVLLESCAAGLPIICTDHCWNIYELVKTNGIVTRSGDIDALANAMADVVNGMCDGLFGRKLASGYSCQRWADRVIDICKEVVR